MEYYKIDKLTDLIEFNDDQLNKAFLLENGEHICILLALKKEQILPAHVSNTDAFIYILEGKVRYTLESPEHKEFELEKGEIMKFKKEEEHTVQALKDSKFIVVRI